jgi:hypothetical protein
LPTTAAGRQKKLRDVEERPTWKSIGANPAFATCILRNRKRVGQFATFQREKRILRADFRADVRAIAITAFIPVIAKEKRTMFEPRQPP